MGIENERERTSSKKDCKHNVLHKPILLKMEKEIINLRKKWFLLQIRRQKICERPNGSLILVLKSHSTDQGIPVDKFPNWRTQGLSTAFHQTIRLCEGKSSDSWKISSLMTAFCEETMAFL